MDTPLGTLVPWLLFAVAAGLKVWQLTIVFRRTIPDRAFKPEQARALLERVWQL